MFTNSHILFECPLLLLFSLFTRLWILTSICARFFHVGWGLSNMERSWAGGNCSNLEYVLFEVEVESHRRLLLEQLRLLLHHHVGQCFRSIRSSSSWISVSSATDSVVWSCQPCLLPAEQVLTGLAQEFDLVSVPCWTIIKGWYIIFIYIYFQDL